MARQRRSSIKGQWILDVAPYTGIAVEQFLHGDRGTAVDSPAIKRAFKAARGTAGKKAACAAVMRSLPPPLRRRLKCSAGFLRFDSLDIDFARALFQVTLRGTGAAPAR